LLPWAFTEHRERLQRRPRREHVYVHSNQPYQDASATADGYSDSYETDGAGHALIYPNGPAQRTHHRDRRRRNLQQRRLTAGRA
jgi:hypothetical protein